MAGTLTAMSKIKQIIQLHKAGISNRSIAIQLGINKETVNNYIRKLKEDSFDMDSLLKLDEPVLEHRLCAGSPAYTDIRFEEFRQLLPYFGKELKRKHVTRYLLWQEYIAQHPGGYRYTQFCYHLSQYSLTPEPTTILADTYLPGEKLFVDFAGDTLAYVDRETGEMVKVQVFVACLPCTDYSYAICVPSQRSEDFIYAIEQCLLSFGGVPRILVPDNLKAAVIKSDRYEPEINHTLEDMGNHYGFVVIPARPRKPKDKSLVEDQVRLIYRRVYAKLRNQTFFSIEELNQAVSEKVKEHNQTRMQQRTYSREEHFLAEEKETLKPLPATRFEMKCYTELQVSPNCCVYLGRDKHYYSVPYQYIGRKVKVMYTRTLVKIYLDGEIIASHSRKIGFGYTTQQAHLASNSNAYKERSPAYYINRSKQLSATLGTLMENMFSNTATPPEFHYKSCEGILQLQRKTSPDIFECACRIALENKAYKYGTLVNLIRKGKTLMDEYEECMMNSNNRVPDNHENIRGAEYYK